MRLHAPDWNYLLFRVRFDFDFDGAIPRFRSGGVDSLMSSAMDLCDGFLPSLSFLSFVIGCRLYTFIRQH